MIYPKWGNQLMEECYGVGKNKKNSDTMYGK